MPVSNPIKGLLGFASVELFGFVQIHSLGIYTRLDGKGKLRMTMPARKLGENRYKFYAQITDEEVKEKILERVAEKISKLGLYNFKTIDN